MLENLQIFQSMHQCRYVLLLNKRQGRVEARYSIEMRVIIKNLYWKYNKIENRFLTMRSSSECWSVQINYFSVDNQPVTSLCTLLPENKASVRLFLYGSLQEINLQVSPSWFYSVCKVKAPSFHATTLRDWKAA